MYKVLYPTYFKKIFQQDKSTNYEKWPGTMGKPRDPHSSRWFHLGGMCLWI